MEKISQDYNVQSDQRVENAAKIFCSFPAAGSKLHLHNELKFKAPWEVSCANLEGGNFNLFYGETFFISQ